MSKQKISAAVRGLWIVVVCLAILPVAFAGGAPSTTAGMGRASGEMGPPKSFAPVVKHIMPSVVNVSFEQRVKGFSLQPFDPPGGSQFDSPGNHGERHDQGEAEIPSLPFGNSLPFQHSKRPQELVEYGLGSGLIVSTDGYVLTNYHVASGAQRIKVTLKDGRDFIAKVVGKDEQTDIALLKINAGSGLPAATLGDSDSVQVGDWVVAIGNPFGFNLSVSSGIISARYRELPGNSGEFLQTDAAINPGNSGGPLVDTAGRVVGITSAIYTNTGTFSGVGFAIPVNLTKHVMAELKEHGHVRRGAIGVAVQELTPELAAALGLKDSKGALVGFVEKGSPAEQAGLRRGDVITKFNRQLVIDGNELMEKVAEAPMGKSAQIEVIRNGKPQSFQVAPIAQSKREDESKQAANTGREPAETWGFSAQGLTPEIARRLGLSEQHGVVVDSVRADGRAADAGLQPGDVIAEINQEKIGSMRDFREARSKAAGSGRPILMLVQRGKDSFFTTMPPAG